jgi:hypothetical protein
MKPTCQYMALAALLFLLTAAPAAAQVQPLTAWWIDTGDTDSTGLGMGLAPLGDINQDGYDDFVASGTLGYYSGNLYVYYGGSQPDTVPQMVIPMPDSTLQWFGLPLFSIGDVNEDGYPDFIAAGSRQDVPPLIEYAYLYYGGPLLDTTPAMTFTWESAQYSDFFGFSGAGLGDINGDGHVDFAITDPQYTNPIGYGAIYIYYGGLALDSIPDLIIRSNSTLNWIGNFIEGLGDVNGDGYADWVMSGPGCHGPNGEPDAGVVAIYYGGNPPDTIPHLVIYGLTGSVLGESLTTLDWNGDGQMDIFAGNRVFYNPDYHGSIWEFNVLPNMTGQPDHIFLGDTGYPGIGTHLFHADLNGDGQQDLMDGEPAFGGIVYIYLNGTGQDTIYDAYYYQGNWNQELGKIGAGIGDINGDGIEDMATSEPHYSGNGRLHVILGDDGLHQSGILPQKNPALPSDQVLLRAHPNPFNSQVALELSIPSLKSNHIHIYNLQGDEIRNFSLDYGQQMLFWDGRSATGLNCSSGIYIAKLTGPTYQTTLKLVLIR